MMQIRQTAVAGSFYPSDPSRLSAMIEAMLADAEMPAVQGIPVAAIAPHAGYVYSGPVAACTYRVIQEQQPAHVIVVAPSHRARFQGASVIPSGEYASPERNIRIHESMAGALLSSKYTAYIPEAHEMEHSLEVQIPFLSHVLKDFDLVPVVLGTEDPAICQHLGEVLANIIKDTDTTMLIISTDLSHFHSYEKAREKDLALIEALRTMDPLQVHDVITTRKSEACGAGPLYTGLYAARKLGATSLEVLKYANSGDTAGPRDEVVGYLSALLTA